MQIILPIPWAKARLFSWSDAHEGRSSTSPPLMGMGEEGELDARGSTGFGPGSLKLGIVHESCSLLHTQIQINSIWKEQNKIFPVYSCMSVRSSQTLLGTEQRAVQEGHNTELASPSLLASADAVAKNSLGSRFPGGGDAENGKRTASASRSLRVGSQCCGCWAMAARIYFPGRVGALCKPQMHVGGVRAWGVGVKPERKSFPIVERVWGISGDMRVVLAASVIGAGNKERKKMCNSSIAEPRIRVLWNKPQVYKCNSIFLLRNLPYITPM